MCAGVKVSQVVPAQRDISCLNEWGSAVATYGARGRGADPACIHQRERAELKHRCKPFVPWPIPCGFMGLSENTSLFFPALWHTLSKGCISFLVITQKGINSEFGVENLGGGARFN